MLKKKSLNLGPFLRRPEPYKNSAFSRQSLMIGTSPNQTKWLPRPLMK